DSRFAACFRTRRAFRGTSGVLDLERGAETAGGIVGLGAVVIEEYVAVAAVAEEGAAARRDIGGRCDPARSRRVELAQRLQLAVLVFRQDFDAHLGGHAEGARLRLVLLARGQRFVVVANAPAAFRALGRAVDEDEAAGLGAAPDDVGLAARAFHLVQRSKLGLVALDPLLDLGPVNA